MAVQRLQTYAEVCDVGDLRTEQVPLVFVSQPLDTRGAGIDEIEAWEESA
jgi:hypothetical protein